MAGPTPTSVLRSLTQARLIELARELGVAVPAAGRKDAQIAKLIEGTRLPLPGWLGYLVRDELRAACREHKIDASSRSRSDLAGALLDAAGLPRGRDTIPPIFEDVGARDVPRRGDIVVVRHRQYLVEAVHNGAGPDATRVALIGLDDDNQGRRTDVLWELELGARVLDQRAELLGEVERLDPPRTFGAYYNALRWNRVTATNARLFQAPFRAGVQLMSHQLTPLKRALDLPRANLFIADDVGLGKTIEAGLVLQELLLRNQVELVVIIAPASVCPQWQREMATRFGLGFELYNRAFVQRRHLMFSFQPRGRVFSHKLYAFALPEFRQFALLQSRLHVAWTWLLSSTMKTDLNYSASDCFETFPFPTADAIATLDAIGQRLYDARATYMVAANQGLTTTYNQLKDPDCASDRLADIEHLRSLHEQLDGGVLAAYGWSDIAVPPYCPRTDAARAALARFEDAVIDRLFDLNTKRAAAEAKAAGTAKPAAKSKVAKAPKKTRGPAAQTSLLDDEGT